MAKSGNHIIIGATTNNPDQYATMPIMDWLTHGVCSGTTNSGKTNYGINFILQFWGVLGQSCVLIEPTENMINDILRRCPPHLLNKITILDIGSNYPVQLKWVDTRSDRSVTVQALMDAIRLNEPASWDSAPRMKRYLRHAFNLVLDVEKENASIVHVMRWLDDDAYRQYTIDNASEWVLESKRFATQLQKKMTDKRSNTDASFDAASTRVDGFLLNDLLRHSVAVPPISGGVDLWELLTKPGQLILVPFKKSGMGDEVRNILGTHVIQSVIRICKARPIRYTKSAPVVLLVDELMNVLHGSDAQQLVKQILSETRQDGLGTLLLFQFLGQLPNKLVEFIGELANTKIVLMQRSRQNAKAALQGFKALLTVDEIMGIEKWHGYVERMVDAEVQPLQYLSMLPPLDYSDRVLEGMSCPPPAPELKADIALLRPYHDLKNDGAKIAYLEALDPDEWQAHIEAQKRVNCRRSQLIYFDAQTEKDPDKRIELARKIAKYRDGFHRNWLEASYRRLRSDGDTESTKKETPEIEATQLPKPEKSANDKAF